MSKLTSAQEKPIVWLHGEVKTPPFSLEARLEAGYLLGRLQRTELPSMPHSRPMPMIGARCHELRIVDGSQSFRIVYRLEADAILILEVFSKKTRATPRDVIDACQRRITRYEQATGGRR